MGAGKAKQREIALLVQPGNHPERCPTSPGPSEVRQRMYSTWCLSQDFNSLHPSFVFFDFCNLNITLVAELKKGVAVAI